jgi:phosphoglycerate dehydrogenase-like enzyme
LTEICVALDGTAIPSAVARWFDDHDVPWSALDPAVESGARALVVGGFTRVGAAELANLAQLEIVVRTGAGYEHVDIDALERNGVVLVAPRLEDDPSVPEFVIGSVIALLRHVLPADAAARSGDWGFRDRVRGRELHGRTFGIVGVGRIGSQVARLAVAFGCRVLAWHPWSERDLPDGVERVESLDELLSAADVVSLNCRLDPSTENLIDVAALKRMRPGSILVNTARGGLVDEEALVAACREGRLAGAVIDTFRGEPAPDMGAFRDQRNIVLSPHVAGMTEESVTRLAQFVGEVCREYLERSELPRHHVVNPVVRGG